MTTMKLNITNLISLNFYIFIAATWHVFDMRITSKQVSAS